MATEIRKILANNVRFYRKKLGLSQEMLGFECGMSNVYISRIESGDFAINIDTLARLAVALKVKPPLLLEPGAHTINPRES